MKFIPSLRSLTSHRWFKFCFTVQCKARNTDFLTGSKPARPGPAMGTLIDKILVLLNQKQECKKENQMYNRFNTEIC